MIRWAVNRIYGRLDDECSNEQAILIDINCKTEHRWYNQAGTSNTTNYTPTNPQSDQTELNPLANKTTNNQKFQLQSTSHNNDGECDDCNADRGTTMVVHVHCRSIQLVQNRIDTDSSNSWSTQYAQSHVNTNAATNTTNNTATSTTLLASVTTPTDSAASITSQSYTNNKRKKRHVWAIKVDCDSKQRLYEDIDVNINCLNGGDCISSASAASTAPVVEPVATYQLPNNVVVHCSNGTCSTSQQPYITPISASGSISNQGAVYDHTLGWGNDFWSGYNNDIDNLLSVNVNCKDHKYKHVDVDISGVYDDTAVDYRINDTSTQYPFGNGDIQYPSYDHAIAHGATALINVECDSKQIVRKHYTLHT